MTNKLHYGVTDVGLLIGDKSFWEKGYGSEAIGLVCDYALEIDLAKLTAGCYVSNAGSIKVFLNQQLFKKVPANRALR